MANKESRPLSAQWRFFIYGLIGFATEVCFTAGWEFVVNVNFKFPGNTSLWSFIIYAVSVLVCEHIRRHLLNRKVPLLLRGIVYTLWAFAWEFFCGLILTHLGWNAWDYTTFEYDIMGVITLEYAPAWYTGSLIADVFVIPYTLQLCWKNREKVNTAGGTSNGEIKQKCS